MLLSAGARSSKAETIIAGFRRQRLLSTTLTATKRLLRSCHSYPFLFNYLNAVDFFGQDVVAAIREDSHLLRHDW